MSASKISKQQQQEADADHTDMTSTTKNTKHGKRTEAASSTSTSSCSSPSSIHPYLRDREVGAIDRWNDQTPSKPAIPTRTPTDTDPVVHAYLQAKMALFQNLSVTAKKSDSSLSTSRSCA